VGEGVGVAADFWRPAGAVERVLRDLVCERCAAVKDPSGLHNNNGSTMVVIKQRMNLLSAGRAI
jgi:hypothetical protein